MNLPGGWELILIVIVFMAMFGYKRLPDATRSLGKSLRIFKAEAKGLRDDDEDRSAGSTSTTTAQIADAPAPPTVPAQPEHTQPKQL